MPYWADLECGEPAETDAGIFEALRRERKDGGS